MNRLLAQFGYAADSRDVDRVPLRESMPRSGVPRAGREPVTFLAKGEPSCRLVRPTSPEFDNVGDFELFAAPADDARATIPCRDGAAEGIRTRRPGRNPPETR